MDHRCTRSPGWVKDILPSGSRQAESQQVSGDHEGCYVGIGFDSLGVADSEFGGNENTRCPAEEPDHVGIT